MGQSEILAYGARVGLASHLAHFKSPTSSDRERVDLNSMYYFMGMTTDTSSTRDCLNRRL